MPTDKEIEAAAKAVRLRDSTDEFAIARAALQAAEKVREDARLVWVERVMSATPNGNN